MAEKVSVEVVLVDAASEGIRQITGVLKDGLASAALAVGAAFVAGIGASVAILKDLTEAASEAELTHARFNAILDSSPLVEYKDVMLGYADSLSKVTRFEDENILEAESMLAVYGTAPDIFKRVLDASLDLAEFQKTDGASGAETLGRALADVAGGSLSLLYRQKLLTQEQKDAAEQMAKTGDASGAQAFVLDILEGKIGNLAETMGNTFQGRLEIFKNTLGNIKEELGDKLLPVLQPVIDKLLELAVKYAPMIANAFEEYVVPAVNSLVEGFTNLLDALDQGKLLEFFNNIDWEGMSKSFAEGINSIDWPAIGKAVGENVPLILEALKTAFEEIDWSVIFDALAVATKEAVDGIFGRDMGDAVRQSLTGTSNTISTLMNTLILPAFYNPLFKIGGIMYGILTGAGGQIVAGIVSWYPKINDELSRLVAMFLQKGTAMPLQIIQAIQGMTSRVINTIRQFIEAVRKVLSGANLSLGINVSIPWGALSQLAQFVAQWNAIASGASGVKGGKSTAPSGGSKGGLAWSGGEKNSKGTDGWKTVPPGFSNDTYPMFMESGERYAVIPKGGDIPSGSPSGGMGGQFIVNLTYAPAFSTADKNEFIQNITPMLNDWYRRRLTS